MGKYLIAMALIFGIMIVGISVDRLYRRFAKSNPKLGPFRAENPKCGACVEGDGCEKGGCG